VKYSSRNQMVNVIAPKNVLLWCADALSRAAGHECWRVNLGILRALPTGVAGAGEFIKMHD
jgi:hypothetical protein